VGGVLSSALVDPGSPTEAEQRDAQAQAVRSSPQALLARRASRTKFKHLDATQAAAVARATFPALIDDPAGGTPTLPAGQRIAGYLTSDAAQLDLPQGKHAVLESLTPIAVASPQRGLLPVDLGLRDADGGFEATNPVVKVWIPRRLADGARLAQPGLSLTPIDASGSPLSGSQGTLDGAGVLYANTQLDADTLIKPTIDGFDENTLLRSPESPRRLDFHVGLPPGATLVRANDGTGELDVLIAGKVVAMIAAPSARDAAGATVPVKMSLSGHTLAVSVDLGSGEYQYPVIVDPEVLLLGTDTQLATTGTKRSNWEFYTSSAANFASKMTAEGGGSLETHGIHAYKEGEWAYWGYQTQGVSKIYEFEAETEAKNKEDRIESRVELQAGGLTEEKELLSTELSNPEYTRRPLPEPLCPKGKESCVPTSGAKGNAVHFEQAVVNAPTSKFSFADTLYQGTVFLAEPENTHSTTSYNTTSSELYIEVEREGKKEKQLRSNALYGSGSWLSEYHGALQLIAKDTGLGVSDTRLEYENAPGKWEQLSEHNYLEEDLCKGVQCYNPEHTEYWTLNTRLPNGEDKIRYRAEEAIGDATHETESRETEGVATVKVDHAKPHGLLLAGVPYGNELSEKAYELTAYASDGEGPTVASSGIKSIELYVDGKSLKAAGEGEGKCSVAQGECEASSKFKIQGSELGAGHHAIVLVAIDNAGNESRREETISIRHSTPVRLGPGSVDLESGDFALGASDVSMGPGLSVARAYSSRDVTAGGEGPLGPQWALSLGTEESLVELVDGSVLVTSANGGETLFAAVLNGEGKPTGTFESPTGDSNLAMTLEENEKHEKLAYYLKDPAAGTTTKFTMPSSVTKLWVPTKQEGVVATDTVSYTYETTEVSGKKVTRPIEALAAVPPKVSCAPKMEPGCRALKFKYGKYDEAFGENSLEWGEYPGRLAKVSYEAYNPATKAMAATTIAAYEYDTKGRLRAEWDPRTSPALKTTYGYDAENHVTALTTPGQESWVFTYAPDAVDAGTGRLIKAAQAPASAGLWKGNLPGKSAAPKIEEATPIDGVAITVSHGTWTQSPVAYSFQWERCNTEGKACTPIAGATNSSYKPVFGDIGHTLVVKVGALNGGGEVTATTAASAEVKAATEYKAGSHPNGIAAGPDGNLWITGEGIRKMTPAGVQTLYGAPAASAITAGPDGNMWFLEQGNAKVGKITTSGAITEYALPAGSEPYGIALGPDSDLWFTEWNHASVGKITTSGAITEYSLPTGSHPGSITAGPDGQIWFTIAKGEDKGKTSDEDKIAKITTSGTITEYALPLEENQPQPAGLTAGPDGNMWFTTSCGSPCYVGKITTTGALTKYPLKEHTPLDGIAAGPEGNLWAVEGSKVMKIATSGAMTEAALPAESQAGHITLGPDGDMWMTDWGTGKVGKLVPVPVQGDPSPQPGTAIEYGVPLSGAGAPYQMGTSEETGKPEPERWGQKDDPVEATAIIPPDSPQGWPAASYKRATVYYLDEQGRSVNVAQPSTSSYGAISTAEYNETNDVVRSLTADDRVTALEAGAKSAEVSKLLSTENTFNGEGAKEKGVTEPGTRLIESVGPQHEVKYIAGKEQREGLARNHEKLFYEDEAAEAETHEKYDLVTRTTDLAQLANEEEVEVRHTSTSYSGQKSASAPAGIGWRLREPTSVTIDPEGAKVTHTTLYNETGQVTETRGPEGTGGESAHDQKAVYYSAEENKEGYAACGNHPEWQGLVCETLPAKQPEASGVPKLPITKTTYNIWDEPETVEEAFGEKTRTTKDTYNAAGGLTSGEETSTATTEGADKALPKVTNEYSTTTGVLEKQSTTVGEITKTITTKYNTLGQLEKYTDADGNIATFKYGAPENDGVLEEMTDSKGYQRYYYNETTKTMTKLEDSSAGTFTASYDAEGKLTSEVFPNGMCANYSENAAGEATHVEYLKTSNCSESKPAVWFSETVVPSVRGEAMSRTSTLASETYSYDTLGRLTQVQETPTGEGCTVRLYAYNEESDRTSTTSRKPGGKGECLSEGGTVEKHTYDEANQLTDAGIAYDPLGNVTKLPAADAEGHELESTFYVDNAVATQTQNGVTNSYYLDPDGRVREVVSGAKKAVRHYDGSGEAVAWTSEGSGETEKWVRNVPGLDGTLAAVVKGEGKTSETPVLQLHDLQGDVVATIKDKAGETELASTYNSTEFGVPNAGKAPPKYAWLGAGGVEDALASGVITEGATSYVPQTGRSLQSEAVAPPGLPFASGGGTGVSFQESPWNIQGAARVGAEAPGLEAGREYEAALAALKACEASTTCDPPKTLYFDSDEVAEICGALDGEEIAAEPFKVLELATTTLRDVAKDLLIDILKELTGLHSPGEWADSIDSDLHACLDVMTSGYRGQNLTYVRCAITAPMTDINTHLPFIGTIEIPDLKKMPTASYCLYYSEHCGEYNSEVGAFLFPSHHLLWG
jgi:streptogramin lyase